MKKGLVLLNMGGPNNLEEVEVFLNNMFNDENIITVKSSILRKLIAFAITTSRKNSAKKNYEKLGGKSPIVDLTKKLVFKLQEKLGDEFVVDFAMRYTPPFAKNVIQKFQNLEIDEVILFPLYPQYSTTTTKSSLEDFYNCAKELKYEPKFRQIEKYYDDIEYNQAAIQQIKEAIKGKDSTKFELIFSAHSLPQKIIDNGDPYQFEIIANVELLKQLLKEEKIEFAGYHLAYQSKLGPVKWLEPSLEEKLKTIKNKNVIIYPIAFTIDNSETEFELSIEYAHIAKELEFENYIVAKCINDSDLFVDFIAKLVNT